MVGQIEQVIDVIQKSELDQTIKDILVNDLHQEGLTDFLKQQISTFCDVNIEKILKE